MASSSGTTTTSSGSGSGSGVSEQIQNSGSEENLQLLMDQRKRKRMVSNRESARRSRKRKQKHLEDLTSQVSELRKENNRIMSSVSVTTQHYMSVEAENLVLRAQVVELSNHLQLLKEMIGLMYQPPVDTVSFDQEQNYGTEFVDEFMMNNSLSYVYANLPILASADMMLY